GSSSMTKKTIRSARRLPTAMRDTALASLAPLGAVFRGCAAGRAASVAALCFLLCSCVPALNQQEPREANTQVPEGYGRPGDETNAASQSWRQFFDDPNLLELVELALKNNQELNIAIQEIYIANSEVLARSGEYLPRVGFGAGAGIEKPGRFTSNG